MTNEELERKLREQEGKFGGQWAAPIASRARMLPSMRTRGKARARVVDGSAVVRITLASQKGEKPRSHTVTHGMSIRSQMAEFLMAEGPHDPAARTALSSILCDAMEEDLSRIEADVAKRAKELLEDKERVAEVRAVLATRAAKKMRTERENLVSAMSSLLSSGWTRENIVEAMNEAVVRSVMMA